MTLFRRRALYIAVRFAACRAQLDRLQQVIDDLPKEVQETEVATAE